MRLGSVLSETRGLAVVIIIVFQGSTVSSTVESCVLWGQRKFLFFFSQAKVSSFELGIFFCSEFTWSTAGRLLTSSAGS